MTLVLDKVSIRCQNLQRLCLNAGLPVQEMMQTRRPLVVTQGEYRLPLPLLGNSNEYRYRYRYFQLQKSLQMLTN